MSILQEGHDLFLRQNSVKESNIKQHTGNCVSKIGLQISTTHQNNVHKNELLKRLEKTILNDNNMCMLATKVIENPNGVDGNFLMIS